MGIDRAYAVDLSIAVDTVTWLDHGGITMARHPRLFDAVIRWDRAMHISYEDATDRSNTARMWTTSCQATHHMCGSKKEIAGAMSIADR
jgi:hypothetical protein